MFIAGKHAQVLFDISHRADYVMRTPWTPLHGGLPSPRTPCLLIISTGPPECFDNYATRSPCESTHHHCREGDVGFGHATQFGRNYPNYYCYLHLVQTTVSSYFPLTAIINACAHHPCCLWTVFLTSLQLGSCICLL
jgi:hypothetical protein